MEQDESIEHRRRLRRSALEERMNRLLRKLFFGIAILLAAAAAIVWCDIQTSGLNPLRAKTLWAAMAGAAAFALAGWKLSTGTKFKIFLLLLTIGFVEVVLQATSWLGVLPGVNTKEILPFGRVYWTSEGRGNSIRNRYGWYYPEFNLEKTNRLAIIGDSFVEAVEVHRTRNASAVLEQQLRGRNGAPAVLAFGKHGTGPAQYLEVLQYAHRHFAITEAVLVIYLGNDVTDCSYALKQIDPEQFIYYSLKPDQSLALDSASARARTRFVNDLEALHRPIWLFLPRLAVSHCMSVQLPLSVQQTRNRRAASRGPIPDNVAEAQLAQLGLKAAPFALNPSPEARDAMAVLKLLLGRAAEFAAEKKIQLRIVTVPFFPPDFYRQTGPDWTSPLGDFDFLAPEHTLAEWAKELHLSFLGLGEQMHKQRLTAKDIHALYLSNGSGHFSESGHRFAAQAMDAAFFQMPASKVE